MTTTQAQPAEQDAAGAPAPDAPPFISTLFGLYIGGLLTLLIDIGNRTGLFDAAARGPATSEQLAARAGLNERPASAGNGARHRPEGARLRRESTACERSRRTI